MGRFDFWTILGGPHHKILGGAGARGVTLGKLKILQDMVSGDSAMFYLITPCYPLRGAADPRRHAAYLRRTPNILRLRLSIECASKGEREEKWEGKRQGKGEGTWREGTREENGMQGKERKGKGRSRGNSEERQQKRKGERKETS